RNPFVLTAGRSGAGGSSILPITVPADAIAGRRQDNTRPRSMGPVIVVPAHTWHQAGAASNHLGDWPISAHMRLRPFPAALALAAGTACAPLADRAGIPIAARYAVAATVLAIGRRGTAITIVGVGLAIGARDRPLAGADDRIEDRLVGVVGAPVIATPR